MFSGIAMESLKAEEEAAAGAVPPMTEDEMDAAVDEEIEAHPGFDVEARSLAAKFDDQRRLTNLIGLINTYGASPALIAFANENNILTRVTNIKRVSRIPSLESLNSSTTLNKEAIVEDLKSINIVSGNESLLEWGKRNRFWAVFLWWLTGASFAALAFGVAGAALGGLIGKVVGGTKGAIIGAGIGANAGQIVGGFGSTIKVYMMVTDIKDPNAQVNIVNKTNLTKLISDTSSLFSKIENVLGIAAPADENGLASFKSKIASTLSARTLGLVGDAGTGKLNSENAFDEMKESGTVKSLGYDNSSMSVLAKQLNALTETIKKDAKSLNGKIDDITKKIDELKGNDNKAQKEALAIQRDAATVALYQFTVAYRFIASQLKSLSQHYKENKHTTVNEA